MTDVVLGRSVMLVLTSSGKRTTIDEQPNIKEKNPCTEHVTPFATLRNNAAVILLGGQLESLCYFDHHTHFLTCIVIILSCNRVL